MRAQWRHYITFSPLPSLATSLHSAPLISHYASTSCGHAICKHPPRDPRPTLLVLPNHSRSRCSTSVITSSNLTLPRAKRSPLPPHHIPRPSFSVPRVAFHFQPGPTHHVHTTRTHTTIHTLANNPCTAVKDYPQLQFMHDTTHSVHLINSIPPR